MKNMPLFLTAVSLQIVFFSLEVSAQTRYLPDKDTSDSIWNYPWIWVTIAAIVIILMVALGRIFNKKGH